MSEQANLAESFLRGLQDRICAAIEGIDGKATFEEDAWTRHAGGGGRTRVLREGAVFEQAGVNFSRVSVRPLPPSRHRRKPGPGRRQLYIATGVSLVLHPRNPYMPTSHANVRYFEATKDGGEVVWWFGGGFDLTPFYPFDEDVRHWHAVARDLCEPFGADVYAASSARATSISTSSTVAKRAASVACSTTTSPKAASSSASPSCRRWGRVSSTHTLPIVERRKDMPYGERERAFQLYRRGRYVEFNLVYDRGTLFGLQSGGRTESILMSLPPQVRFEYAYAPEPGSAEARLADYLKPRDWLCEAPCASSSAT